MERVWPQVGRLVVAAGADTKWARELGCAYVADSVSGAGPLSGVLAGMEWAACERPAFQWVATFAVDCPFVPKNLVRHLRAELDRHDEAEIAVAVSAGRTHPVFSLMPVGLAADLRGFLAQHGNPSISSFFAEHRVVQADFPTASGVDPFFNVNHAPDLDDARHFLLAAPH